MGARAGFVLGLLAVIGGCAETQSAPTDASDGRDARDTEDAAEDRADAPPDTGCRPGQTLCSGTCTDLTTDPAHCGSCSRACAAGEVCNEGSCASSCTAGRTNCSGACVDLQTDNGHCGSCTVACTAHEECRSGSCACLPDCTGRECGSDGCSGSCGTCPTGRECGDDGRCFCAANCVGRECGDDGCGGSCGTCMAGSACTPAGSCTCSGTPCGSACCSPTQVCLSGSCCESTWKTTFTQTVRALARDGDGTLYVAGTEGIQAWVAAVDACGVPLREGRSSDPSALTTSVQDVAISGSDLYVTGQTTSAGTDPGNGFWARAPKTSLSPTWSNGLWGGDLPDEVWAVGVTDAGDGWLVGTGGISATGSYPWVIRGYATGLACGFNPFPTAGGGAGRNLALAGGRVYVVGSRDGLAFVTSWGVTECGWTPPGPCPCEPSGTTVTFAADGAGYTEARGVAVAGANLYLAGYSDIGGDIGALVARVAGLAVTQAPRWNPTSAVDGFAALASDGTGGVLYAVGTSGWPGSGETGSGVLARYGAAGLTAEWQAYPSGVWGCWDVVTDEAGGVIVACQAPGGGGSLHRCLPSGVCP